MSIALIKAPISLGAYNRGWTAFRAGVQTCPHASDHRDYAPWHDGHAAARDYFGDSIEPRGIYA